MLSIGGYVMNIQEFRKQFPDVYSGEIDQRNWRDGDRRSAVKPTSVPANATKVVVVVRQGF
jgi:hypothetical protein